MNNAGNLPMDSTSNIYEVGADSSQRMENGFPAVERPNIPDSVEEPPPPYTDVSSASDPPIYAVVCKNRAGNGVVQSEASAPAGDTADGDDCTNPPIIYQELTLVDK